jgi:excisionase family DNA binding protein
MGPTLVRIREAAAETGVPRSTLYRVVSSGMIPSIRIGRSVYLRAETLRRWITDREQAGSTSVK